MRYEEVKGYAVLSCVFKTLLKTRARVILVPRGAALPTSPGRVNYKRPMRPSQRAVFGFVQRHDLLAAAAVFAHLGHFPPQRCVFSLQEDGADGDLVLFQTPGVARALRRHVVLVPPRPVFIILRKNTKSRKTALVETLTKT